MANICFSSICRDKLESISMKSVWERLQVRSPGSPKHIPSVISPSPNSNVLPHGSHIFHMNKPYKDREAEQKGLLFPQSHGGSCCLSFGRREPASPAEVALWLLRILMPDHSIFPLSRSQFSSQRACYHGLVLHLSILAMCSLTTTASKSLDKK